MSKMSNDLANNKAHGQHDSVSDHASEVFEKSSVCVVSTILSTKNKPRRIFLSVVFVFFTFAFFYQCIAFLYYVLQHPTIVDHESIRPEKFVSPAYTFCNYNILKRSKYCEIYPRNCTRPTREFFFENPRFCGTPDTKILKSDTLDFDSRREMFEMNHDGEDLVHFDDEDEDKPVGPLARVNENDGIIAACFSYYGRVDSPLDPFMRKRAPTALMSNRDVFTFDPQENELIYPDTMPGVMFDIHSPFEASNPYETGIYMRPGYLYRIRVKVTQEELLPHDCINYTEVWLRNGKTGHRSQAACRQKCLGDLVLKCFNCSEALILYPYPNVGLCEIDDQEMKTECKNMEHATVECINECKDDCLKLKYSYEVQELFRNRYMRWIGRNESRTIRVIVEFRDLDIQKIVHKPQFQVLEVFSLIGGLLAFWIGLSMFQVVEVFDYIFQLGKNVSKKRSASSESTSA